jgi:hypothetical protein
MCKELPVILVNKVVDPKRIIGKKWRAEEEERHKGLLTQKKQKNINFYSKALQNIPKLVFLVRKYTIWQPLPSVPRRFVNRRFVDFFLLAIISVT